MMQDYEKKNEESDDERKIGGNSMTVGELYDFEEFKDDNFEFDDRFFFYLDGKIVPPQQQKYMELCHSAKSSNEISQNDPFGLGQTIFYNIEFDIEMSKPYEDVTYIYNGVISNK